MGKEILSDKRDPALLIILLYCILYASARLLVSSSLELDEAEQFLNGSVLQMGYPEQPPLYSWMVWLTSSLLGRCLFSLILVKYFLLFLFYLSFYRIARLFWDRKESILVMSSLMLFTTYSYESNRDLSHTVMVALFAALACLVYLRLLLDPETAGYFLLGALTGLGMLAKYNFALFPGALLLASLSTRLGRRLLFDKRILIILFSSFIVFLPHLLWLLRADFLSLRFAADKSSLGTLGVRPRPIIFFIKAYAEVITFIFVILLFFGKDMVKPLRKNKGAPADSLRQAVRALAVYGITLPLLGILFSGSGHFQSRWLAPIYFTLPLAFFSLFTFRIGETRSRLFGYLCLLIAAGILALRLFVGFFPDYAGRVERIHVPYGALAKELSEGLARAGINSNEITFIADQRDYVAAANIMQKMHTGTYIPLKDVLENAGIQKNIKKKGGVLLQSISKQGADFSALLQVYPLSTFEVLRAPYLHSQKFPPYELGAIIIPPQK